MAVKKKTSTTTTATKAEKAPVEKKSAAATVKEKVVKTISRSKKVPIEIYSPNSQRVELAGSFNNWEPRETPLERDASGYWKGTLNLKPGRYEYKVVFDGASWEVDPNKETIPGEFGPNNLLVVS